MKRGNYSCNDCCKHCEWETFCPHSCFPIRKCKNCKCNKENDKK